MSLIDDVLTKFSLKYEDLLDEERNTLDEWMSVLGKGELNVGSVKEYIAGMKDAVEDKLTQTGHNNKEDLFLKARLKNYKLLESFLTSRERARKSIEQQISAIAGRVK
jgi:hypothetical protein